MIGSPINTITGNRFLREASVYSLVDDERIHRIEDPHLAEAVQACESQLRPLVMSGVPGRRPTILSIPIFREGELKSIVSFIVEDSHPTTGVFEVWSPTGPYQDLHLSSGYYGELDRFQNVSSYVRFEMGSGLPGQAWKSCCAVIHDDLKNHPGFLRAAGASADSLQTAIGIPVYSRAFVSTVVLISSKATPMTRAMEVWKPVGNDFELVDRAYGDIDKAFQLPIGTKLNGDFGLLGMVRDAESAVVTDDQEVVLGSRHWEGSLNAPSRGIGIPTYVGGDLSCITLLVP
jgi:hypothetical protein